jgi:hypothetical protein
VAATQPCHSARSTGAVLSPHESTSFLPFVLTLAVFGLAAGWKKDKSGTSQNERKTYEIK